MQEHTVVGKYIQSLVPTYEVDRLYSARVSRATRTFASGEFTDVPPSLANIEMLKLPSPRNGKVLLKVNEMDKLLLLPMAKTSGRGHSIRVSFSVRKLQIWFYE